MQHADFDPNGVGNVLNNIFGLPFSTQQSKLVFIPVPWDVTVSNHEGTCDAPRLIFEQSSQIDLYDSFSPGAWQKGMAMEEIDQGVLDRNLFYRSKAKDYIRFLEEGGVVANMPVMKTMLDEINLACEQLIDHVEDVCHEYLGANKIPFLIGGDHSISLGNIRAVSARYPGMGILQIDAHADLRFQYQGFVHSHASVMRSAIGLSGVAKLIQVGIRELCNEELELIASHPEAIVTCFDRAIHDQLFNGESWSDICTQVVNHLPDQVYVSFDMDGLDPSYCPNTGTPVPGGLSYNQALYLLEMIVRSGRRIVGADLVETGPASFDAMMACRVLYRMAGMMLRGVRTSAER